MKTLSLVLAIFLVDLEFRLTEAKSEKLTSEPLWQIYNGAECPGDIFEFWANVHPTSGTYVWEVFNGASIVSGQSTSKVLVQSPSSGGFRIDLIVDGQRYVDLAEYGICDEAGPGGPGSGGSGPGGSGNPPLPTGGN